MGLDYYICSCCKKKMLKDQEKIRYACYYTGFGIICGFICSTCFEEQNVVSYTEKLEDE